MKPFAYDQPKTLDGVLSAIQLAATAGAPPTGAPAQFIAGGTNMSDYMKLEVMQPEQLVDLNRVGDPALKRIELTDGGIRLGALVRMSEAAGHADILARYPVLAESLALAASAQIRNMASLAGNVLQRTRCEYFREVSWPCNKRNPGSGCSALDGVNRHHAVLGASDACIATYHGDFAQALIALDAVIEVRGPGGDRQIPIADLHRLPGDTPDIETVLSAADIMTAITIPATPFAARSLYLKVRDRQSYAFALSSAAVALDLDGGAVREARIALGGVATVPWRAREAEDALRGKTLDEANATEAAKAAFAGARTREHNAYKVELGQRTLVRALLQARDMEVPA